MPVYPTLCFKCKNTWLGKGPICNVCRGIKPCNLCGGAHAPADCSVLVNQYIYDALRYAMARTGSHKFTAWQHNSFKSRAYNARPLLKTCPACKSNYLIESKAGSICAGCRNVVHLPCRNCNSINTHGLAGDSQQFIECSDCQFME